MQAVYAGLDGQAVLSSRLDRGSSDLLKSECMNASVLEYCQNPVEHITELTYRKNRCIKNKKRTKRTKSEDG